MECSDHFCWSGPASLSNIFALPELPPPPPLPSFLYEELQIDNSSSDSCDLCSKWGVGSSASAGQTGDNFSFVLALVAFLSALCGAGIMAAILSIKRIRRRRKYQNGSDSMRHLERKCTEQSLPLPPSRSANSTPMSNTYCEGPYSDKDYHCSNIYAELHPTPRDVWRRPPIPTPVDNCYLELRDLPASNNSLKPMGSTSPPYSLSTSTSTSYYTDLELKSNEPRC